MAPRRSGRRNISAYSKGDYIEYQYKGSTVTGKLLKKANSGTAAKPIWIVSPTDRRRKNEEIPEKALGKVIDAQEAMNNRGPKLKKGNTIRRESSHTSNQSDSSFDEPQAPKRKSGRGSPSDDHSNDTSGGRKRKSDDSNVSEKGTKSRRAVTFSQESNTTTTSKQNKTKKAKQVKATSTRIGTRSTRGSGEAILLPDLPIKRKKNFPKGKKLKKDENVRIIRMLTGTLYLFRGDRPRAEFVRSK